MSLAAGSAGDEGRPQMLYHAVGHRPALPEDFYSYAQEGKRPPQNATGETRRLYSAVSAWDTLTRAVEIAKAFGQGGFIAELDVERVEGFTIEKTRGPGHYSLFGSPESMLGAVVRVLSLSEAEAEAEANV